MKIKFQNSAGHWEVLTCDCGNNQWELALSDEQGDAFKCTKCGKYSPYIQNSKEIKKWLEKGLERR